MSDLPPNHQEIDALKRRLDRERRARAEAEAISERVTRALYQKQQELDLLQKIAVAANRAISVADVLQTSVDAVCAYCQWPVGHVYLAASDGSGELVPSGIWHLDHPDRFETFQRVTQMVSFAPGVGLPGRVMESGRPVWVRDVNVDPNFPRATMVSRLDVKAGFGFPVLVGNEVVAVLEFFSEEAVEPNQALLELVTYVGAQLGRVVERKRAEDALRQRAVQLEAAIKEVESFSYSISHDLRTPLRAANGFSRILVDEYGEHLPAEAQRYLNLVRQSTEQMGRLVDDLLTFSRLGRQPLKTETVALEPLVRGCLVALQAEQANRTVDIVLRELPECKADSALLRQAFMNLLENALKFTRSLDRAVIEVGCRVLDGERVFFVRDNGVGFDMRYVGKLFGMFQRLHRIDEYEGTGVGLAIVQRVIQRHGGRVWAEGAVGEGATFSFTLP